MLEESVKFIIINRWRSEIWINPKSTGAGHVVKRNFVSGYKEFQAERKKLAIDIEQCTLEFLCVIWRLDKEIIYHHFFFFVY